MNRPLGRPLSGQSSLKEVSFSPPIPSLQPPPPVSPTSLSSSTHTVGPTTFEDHHYFKLAHNLWLHGNRFYAVMDSFQLNSPQYSSHLTDILFSTNIAITKFPVPSLSAHQSNTDSIWLRGTTLWLDYPNPAKLDDLGTWAADVLLPNRALLSSQEWTNPDTSTGPQTATAVISTIVFPNLQRSSVAGFSWVNDFLKLAIKPGIKEGRPFPRVLFWDDLYTSGNKNTLWVGLERVVTAQPREKRPPPPPPSEGEEDINVMAARAMREEAYRLAEVPRPSGWEASSPPLTITYLMSFGNDGTIINNGPMLRTLREIGESTNMQVRPFSVTPGAAFTSHIAAMAKTGVLVARHGPLLADCLFLPPGSVLVELLPYNWDWAGESSRYYNMTRLLGDVIHLGWRAGSDRWVVYQGGDDKYRHWTPDECGSKSCTDAHGRAGLIANVEAVKRMLMDVLPQIKMATASNSNNHSSIDDDDYDEGRRRRIRSTTATLEARWPWPKFPYRKGGTGLWWDSM
jgi:hypothetical protein